MSETSSLHTTVPVETVTIKVDGAEVQVPKGTNVLEACAQVGKEISSFCYHAGLSSPAVCRQCLVEVAGQPKLVPSCYTPVADKMEVITSSPRVEEARAQMLEFTLVNHPVDCPICDKAGECTLQKLYMDWDGRESRTEFDKVHKPKAVDLGPTIVLDAERCILCTRCVRVCDEVAGEHQLEITQRGDRAVLAVAPGQILDNPYSLNTVDVCPVGALTSKDFRFRMRAWELYATPSVCPGCSTGCNIEVHHHQGEIWRLVPRENQEVNRFWMCDEGRMTYKQVHQNRLAGARMGSGKGLPAQRTNPEKAVAQVAQRLNQTIETGGTIGLVFGAQAENEGLYALARVAQVLKQQGASVRCYVSGRAAQPGRADNILRRADVNPNTQGALFFAGQEAFDFQQLCIDLSANQIQALWMLGEDVPLEKDQASFLALLDRLPLVVMQTVQNTIVAQHAHVMLPAASWAETDGSFVNDKGMVQRIRQAISPAGDAKPHASWISLIAQKAGWARNQPWQGSPKQIFADMVGNCVASMLQGHAAGLAQTLTQAQWGIDKPAVQLRFAHSRG